MADTARTLSEVQSLLGNNNTGAISPQDIRDMLESLLPDFGEIHYNDTPVEDEIETKDVWIEATAGTWLLTASPVPRNFSMGVAGRLQYDGNETRLVLVSMPVVMISAGNNKTYEFAIGVNGTPIDETISQRTIGTGSEVGATSCAGLLSIAPGNYLSLMVRNITDTTNLTFNHANIIAVSFLA